MKSPDISISIASFNTALLLQKCLKSIEQSKLNLKIQTIVVDNASQDLSIKIVKKKFPNVKLIQNKYNNYFSKSHNQALEIALGKYFLILNSDTMLSKNTLVKTFKFMEKNPKIAALTVKEKDEKNILDRTCSRFPNPLIEFYESNIFGNFLITKSF